MLAIPTSTDFAFEAARLTGDFNGPKAGARKALQLAHGDFDWINKGRYRSTAGELCCGVDDCYQVAPERVLQDSQGYSLPDHNMSIPAKEAIPSEDGKYWICKIGSRRRCFFAPLNGF
jgi:hypothetical protein